MNQAKENIIDMKLQFLSLIQSNQFSKAKKLSEQILKLDSNIISIYKFDVFLNKFKERLETQVQKLQDNENEENNEDLTQDYNSSENETEDQIQTLVQDDEVENNQYDENDVELGYGYYDPINPTYNIQEYQLIKQKFIQNLQNDRDLKMNIQQSILDSQKKDQKTSQSMATSQKNVKQLEKQPQNKIDQKVTASQNKNDCRKDALSKKK